MNRPAKWDLGGGLLAILWIVLFTVQYIGAWQRTRLQLGMWAPFAGMQGLDLLSSYGVLCAVTVLFLVIRQLFTRTERRGNAETQ